MYTPGASSPGYLSILPPCAHPTNIPLLTSSNSSKGQTIVPSDILATDTCRFQYQFPWLESGTAAHPGFPPTFESITSKSPCLSIYFDPLLNLCFVFLWFPTYAPCSSILYMILGDHFTPQSFYPSDLFLPVFRCMLMAFPTTNLPKTSQLVPGSPTGQEYGASALRRPISPTDLVVAPRPTFPVSWMGNCHTPDSLNHRHAAGCNLQCAVTPLELIWKRLTQGLPVATGGDLFL